jgi:hypothetical protein
MKIMKRIYFVVISITLFLTSCNKDILDLKPTDKISDAAIWADINLVQGYVDECYNSISMTTMGMPNGFGSNQTGWGNYSAVYGYWTGGAVDEVFELHDKDGWCIQADLIVRGELSPSRLSSLGRWSTNYGLIRAINNYFEHADAVKGDAALISRFSSEMYFLRAFNYVHLVKNFGGVPIITKVYSTNDTKFEEARNTFDECSKSILVDLDKAIAGLPLTYSSSGMGRVTKGAAMALKANFLLFAASPLNNASNDQAKWKAASDAAKAVIDLGTYSLYKPAKYENIFLDRANSEVILAKYYNSTASDWGPTNFESTVDRDLSPNGFGGWGMGTPSQNIVDDFEMADGSKFDWNNPVLAANPYKNRDPRFYASIFYDGMPYKGRTIDTYEGGQDNPIGATVEPTNATVTGYFLRKYVNPTKDVTKWVSDCQAIFIRLSEIYLNYAEAQNALGNDGEALKYVNMIRQRAGMPDVTGAGTVLRDKIRQERRIELAFEGQRYYDLRRWKILEQGMGNAMGIKIVKNIDGTKTYSKKTVQTRIYSEKVYWQPIPVSEIQKNSKLLQNPGY